jgi:cytochrome c-type biogenesis protein CcsB
MEISIVVTILMYIMSSAGYFAYLFFQKNDLQKAGYGLLLIGFVSNTASIAFAYIKSGVFPVHNLHETLLIVGWSIAGVFLIFQYKYNLKILGVFAAPLATTVIIISSLLPGEIETRQEIFNNFWLIIHIFTVFTGEAAFALACGSGVLYLLQERAIKKKSRGFFFKRLPSLELIDSTGYACIVVGFTLLTIGLATGFIYAKSVWGKFWSWDPKEVWSGITWLLYAALLHERLAVGWRGRRAAIMAIVGFGVLLFTFLGVNFFLEGHHGEFTRF